jgi:hypothetical protein
MNAKEIYARMRDADPASDRRMEPLELGPAEATLAEGILAAATGGHLLDIDMPHWHRNGLEPRSRRRLLRPAALVVGAAIVIAAVLLVVGAFGGGGTHPTYAAAAIEVAEANPRLLVTAPGWQVTDAGEFEADNGETIFGDGRRTFELHWYPARLYRSYLRDRAQVSPPQRSRLLGRTATTVEYGHQGEYATMIAPIGTVFVEVRGRLGGHAAYEEVLRSLRAVDIETWLAAMPASVVSPDARAHTVATMLRGVPYPPGFDPSLIENETAVLNHYQLGVRVADSIACGWVESWLAAQASGDGAAARDAVAAMASSHHWPLLLQMEREQGLSWAHNIWHAAAELRRGHLDEGFGGALVRPDGSGYKMGPAWAMELQCTSKIRRVPFAAGEAPGAER